MEAEISLLMANQTLVCHACTINIVRRNFSHPWDTQASPGKLVYDPFIGTGSMAYVCPCTPSI